MGQRGPDNQFAALNQQRGQDEGYDSLGIRSMSGQQALNDGHLLTPDRGKNMGCLSHEQDAVLSAAHSMVGGGFRYSSPVGSHNKSYESSMNPMHQEHRPGAAHSHEGSRDRLRDCTSYAANVPHAADLSRDVVENVEKLAKDHVSLHIINYNVSNNYNILILITQSM